MPDFNIENSARRIVQKMPNWKSRRLNMSSRHRGTTNFGDIIPGYWLMVSPKDKIKADANGIVKFMPFIAPAFVDMKVKIEWFYVPLKIIAPKTLRMLQDYKPDTDSNDIESYMSNQFIDGARGHWINYGVSVQNRQSIVKDDSQVSYFPSLPAVDISSWLCDFTWTPIGDKAYGSNLSPSFWRSPSSTPTDLTLDNIGYESLNGFVQKFRVSKFLSYLGLPKSLTTMRFNCDIIPRDLVLDVDDPNMVRLSDNELFSNDDYDKYINYSYRCLTDHGVGLVSEDASFYHKRYRVPSDGWTFTQDNPFVRAFAVYQANRYKPEVSFVSHQMVLEGGTLLNSPCCLSTAPITLLPAQAYQIVYNQFYRDQKIMKDEILLYKDIYSLDGFAYFRDEKNVLQTINLQQTRSLSTIHLYNNLFGLRRRNYELDLFSSCYDDGTVLAGSSSQALNATNVSLLSSIRRYLLKKEMTGSTMAEWLSKFFGTRGSDYLNNNVVFLGGDEIQVNRSEVIQQSQPTDSSAQGNRSGLADSYPNGKEIYFEAPDFGILLCNVSVIPDSPDNFNGLQRRFRINHPLDFNLPDLQNIGFTPVYYNELNLIGFERLGNIGQVFIGSTDCLDTDAFGYQPFGYQHTYVPNIISGDLQNSLSFWHQSPDYSIRPLTPDILHRNGNAFTSSTPRLNLNYRAIGRRFMPMTNDSAAQYYNNPFAITNDESGDHIVFDMYFNVYVHRHTAFFTTGLPESN